MSEHEKEDQLPSPEFTPQTESPPEPLETVSNQPMTNEIKTKEPPNNSKLGGCGGAGIGCIGGFFYLLLVLSITIGSNIAVSDTVKKTLFDILSLIGPLPILYFARRQKNSSLFWGFLIPYMLVLLLFGMCTR